MPMEDALRAFTEENMDFEVDRDLSLVSSMRTGGKAECIIYPHNAMELERILEIAYSCGLEKTVFGKLTNTLVSDSGIAGLSISMERFKGITIKGDLFIASAGEMLDSCINRAIEHHLSGLEELGGIPGTVGGATACNAGAHGKEISTWFFYSDYITCDGRIRRMPAYSDAFSYRTSPFRQGDMILSTAFRLKPDRNTALARERKEKFRQERIEKGQFRHPSLGSFFKNPPLLSAGRLIEEAGFKGFEHKGAMVSPYHANFIVNAGGATSTSIFELGEIIRNAVARIFNIDLEYEVRFLGKFD